MCGIVGALTFNNSDFKVTEAYINKMRDEMTHRGPDSADTWISQDQKIGLGHRRLSIIDLSTNASQPMCNEDSTLWVSFNGEIYNHREIRNELDELGKHIWKTDHSDTEVILHSFEEWGIDCIKKFRGMFSISIWDTVKKELWLIRDFVGIKPLYYSIHSNRIVFSSEIKALLKDPGQERAVNENAFYHYLSFLTTPAPDTLFKGIKKLPGGSWLKINENGTIKQEKYWDVLDNTIDLKKCSEEEITKKILSTLKESVKYRKESDVSVGVFLSGGIDSSTNAALFSEDSKKPVNTFTIGYKGKYKSYENETDYAKKMANTINAKYNEKLLEIDDLINFLPKMVYLQDEPISDPVCIPVYYVSKLARDNEVIVCQVGEGADELFWGYPSWKKKLILQRLNDLFIPKFIKKLILKVLKLLGKEDKIYYEWLRRGIVGQKVFWGGAEAFTETQKKKILSKRMREKFNGKTSWDYLKKIYENFIKKAKDKSNLNWMSYIDLNLRLPELLLMRVDKMSMGVSLETRVPFLDHKFVELAMSIPESLKTKKGILKYMLKKAVRGVIPDELIDRKKQGFGVPIYEWFYGKLGTTMKEKLNNFCNSTDYLDINEINKLFKNGSIRQIWYLFNFVLWWEKYIV